ncbi:unnamed protein product [Urochloa humidicola]
MALRTSVQSLALLALLLSCAVTMSGAVRMLEEEAAAPKEDQPEFPPHLPVPEHELPDPFPEVHLPPKPELPPFPEVDLPPKPELPEVELPPKPEIPAIPEFHFPEPEANNKP